MSVSTCREIGTEELFELIFQLTPDAMIAVGADGRIAFANAQVEGIFGYDANELAGRCVDDLLPKSLRARHKRYRTAYLENPSRRSMGDQSDLRGLHKSGRELFVDISLNAVDTVGGQFVLAAIRDVSELRRTNELMRRNEQRFHAAASSSTDFFWEA